MLINCGGLHEVETVPEGPSLLRSLVFHPRLVGGMDTVFWQKLVSPLQAPGAPAYVLLDAAVPWQAQALEVLSGCVAGGKHRCDGLRKLGALPHLHSAAAGQPALCRLYRYDLAAGAGSLPADEADAALYRGALCGGADRGPCQDSVAPQRERLSAELSADAGAYADPIR